MNSQTFITIKEPCHQNWDEMGFSEKGKFCSSCKKNVHDFSNSSIDEIKKAYLESSDGLCIKISGKLLNEQYVASQTQRAYFSYARTFCLAAIFCFGASLFTIQSAKANVLSHIKNKFFQMVSDTNVVEIKGVVLDKESKEPLLFAPVFLLQGDSVLYSTSTDIDGKYKFILDSKKYMKLDLKVIYVGYENVLIKDILLMSDKTINMDLKLNLGVIGGVMSEGIYYPPLLDQFSTKTTITGDQYRRMPK